MSKAIALLAIPLVLQGCSYTYPIWATMVDGRLAFESGDRAYDCFTNIGVYEAGPPAPDPAVEAIEDPLKRADAEDRARAAWKTDAVATYECKGHFPVVYGAPMPGITIVAAKPLRIGVPYVVSTYGPKGAGGDGCFRINPDRRPENLPDQECAYSEPPPVPPRPAAVVAPAQPAPPPPKPQVQQVPGVPGGMATNTVSAPARIVTASPIPPTPINALPPPDRTGPSQMYALTPYRGIERYVRDYRSLAACEAARAKMTKAKAERRLCGFGPRRPLF